MIRIAHISDTHVLPPHGVRWREMFFNKRITGWANTRLRRGRVYRRRYLEAVLDAASRADHLVVTGDITNLALESEFHEALRLFRNRGGAEVTVIPGNHDLYLPRISREGRFEQHFSAFVRSDLPALSVRVAAGSYPFVKLRGPVAIIGLSSAVPRPPFIAAGYLGDDQLRALHAILEHPEVSSRFPVILIHHPPLDSRSRLFQLRDGLTDAASLCEVLALLRRGLVLFGHVHMRVRCRVGSVDIVGAGGAALDHPDDSIRAGYNLYVIDDDGARIESHVIDPAGSSFRRADVPMRRSCI